MKKLRAVENNSELGKRYNTRYYAPFNQPHGSELESASGGRRMKRSSSDNMRESFAMRKNVGFVSF